MADPTPLPWMVHDPYLSESVMPEWLVRLSDQVRLGLPAEEAAGWSARLSAVIPPEAASGAVWSAAVSASWSARAAWTAAEAAAWSAEADRIVAVLSALGEETTDGC